MILSENQQSFTVRILKNILILSLIFVFVPKNVSAALAPISCNAIYNNNLSMQIDHDFDSRLAGLTSATGTINQWTQRGNGTNGWVRNTAAWTQNGSQSIDWTGVSPWNSDGGYTKAGVLISPKHVAFARHYQMPVGTIIIFIDLQGNIVSRTITKTASLTSADITIGELDSEVPSSITYYPIIDAEILEKKLDITNLPLVAFDQDDHLIVAEHNGYSFERRVSWLTDKALSMSIPEKSNRALFNESIGGGDSGNPIFTIIHNTPVLLSTITAGGQGGGTLYAARIAEINSVIAGFNSSTTVSGYDISCWNDAVQEIAIKSSSDVTVNISSIQNNDVVTAFAGQNIHSSAYIEMGYEIISGNTNNVFSIQNPVKNISCYSIPNCIYSDGKLKLQDKTKLVLGAQHDLVIRATTTTSVGMLTKDFPIHVTVMSTTTGANPYTWSTKNTLTNTYGAVQSKDGTKMYATKYSINNINDYIYKSVDSGDTWSPLSTLPSTSWQNISVSAQGDDIYAQNQITSDLYISHDSGQSFSTSTGFGSQPWKFIDTTTNGSTVVAFSRTRTQSSLVSRDFGITWSTIPELGRSSYWTGISMSDDAQTIVAIHSTMSITNPGYVYISKDGGATWNIILDQSRAYRAAVAVSGDGQTIIIAEEEKYIHISKDGGLTWSIITSTGEQSWFTLSLSDNGSSIAATTRFGMVFYSRDRGNTWFSYNGSNGQSGTKITVSGNGNSLVQTGIYMSTKVGTSSADIVPVQYPIISSIVTSSTSTSATINWQTNTPTTSQIEYGLTSSYTSSSTLNIATTTMHSVSLLDLLPGTIYHFRIKSTDTSGNIIFSSDQSFVTTQLPTVVVIAPVSSGGGGGSGGGGSYPLPVPTVVKLEKASSTNAFVAINSALDKVVLTPIVNTQKFTTLASVQAITKDFQILSQSVDVKNIQKFLNSQGFIISKTGPGSIGKETTLFGPATKAALIKFQKINRIPATGVFGPVTRAKIKNLKL